MTRAPCFCICKDHLCASLHMKKHTRTRARTHTHTHTYTHTERREREGERESREKETASRRSKKEEKDTEDRKRMLEIRTGTLFTQPPNLASPDSENPFVSIGPTSPANRCNARRWTAASRRSLEFQPRTTSSPYLWRPKYHLLRSFENPTGF